MRRRFENMTPEQIEEFRARRRERGGPGGGGGGWSGRGGGATAEGKATKTIYLFEKRGDKPVLKPVTVTLGITDGAYTEVIDGLKEGDVIVTGQNLPAAAMVARPGGPMASPFGRPFGGGGGFRGR
jgi:hypothetical protein